LKSKILKECPILFKLKATEDLTQLELPKVRFTEHEYENLQEFPELAQKLHYERPASYIVYLGKVFGFIDDVFRQNRG
jgi:hypothetical protein